MSKPKNHHLLPQKAYLEGFTEGGRLWVFDRVKNEFRRQSPKRTTTYGHFYSFEDHSGERDWSIENPGLSNLEGATVPILKKLERREQISLDERSVFALFISFMKVRTVSFHRMHDVICGQLHKWRNRHVFSSPERVRNIRARQSERPRPDAPTAEELCDFFQRGDYEVKFHRNASLEMMLRLGLELAPIIASLDWIVGHSPSTMRFITTDEPFVIFPSSSPLKLRDRTGILVTGATKIIPLSRSICLSMRDVGGGFAHVDLTEEAVRATNLGVASFAERLVIADGENLLRDVVAEAMFTPNQARVGI